MNGAVARRVREDGQVVRKRRPSARGLIASTSMRTVEPHADAAPAQAPRQFSRVLAQHRRPAGRARQEEERRRSAQDRLSDAITRFTGSMRFVYIHALLFGVDQLKAGLGTWSGAVRSELRRAGHDRVGRGDLPLSTFVLISQNRMQALADKRAWRRTRSNPRDRRGQTGRGSPRSAGGYRTANRR